MLLLTTTASDHTLVLTGWGARPEREEGQEGEIEEWEGGEEREGGGGEGRERRGKWEEEGEEREG